MHEKLIEGSQALEKTELGEPLGSRCVRLPPGLTEADLARLTVQEIDAVIRQAGPVIGYASLIKLASGGAGTPPQTQFHAAKFLVEQSAALQAVADKQAKGLDKLKALSAADLEKVINGLLAGGEVLDLLPEE